MVVVTALEGMSAIVKSLIQNPHSSDSEQNPTWQSAKAWSYVYKRGELVFTVAAEVCFSYD